jgi:hypothetical protein
VEGRGLNVETQFRWWWPVSRPATLDAQGHALSQTQGWLRPSLVGVVWALAALWMTGIPSPARAYWEYMSEAQAIDAAFPNGERVVRLDLDVLIESEQRLATERELGVALGLAEMSCYQGSKDGIVVAYACIDEVIGRSKPITFMVKIAHPSGELAWYEILVYREYIGNSSRGGPFRQQFLGKTIDAPLQYGNDIRNLQGATLTSEHLVDAFRKHFLLYKNHFKLLGILPELPPEHFKERDEARMRR